MTFFSQPLKFLLCLYLSLLRCSNSSLLVSLNSTKEDYNSEDNLVSLKESYSSSYKDTLENTILPQNSVEVQQPGPTLSTADTSDLTIADSPNTKIADAQESFQSEIHLEIVTTSQQDSINNMAEDSFSAITKMGEALVSDVSMPAALGSGSSAILENIPLEVPAQEQSVLEEMDQKKDPPTINYILKENKESIAPSHAENQPELSVVSTSNKTYVSIDLNSSSSIVKLVESISATVENELDNIENKTQEIDLLHQELSATESEVMPSFDEWKKKMLAEQQGEKPFPLPLLSGKKPSSQLGKSRRNYASAECGAKIVASNFEADSPNSILNEQLDMYMLNPCKAKIWFVIELCENIQITQFEMANFELFSSLPKEFTLNWSDRFPTRDWTALAYFLSPDQRILHTFDLKHPSYGKFLKVDLLSHYGKEHYCPLSLVRVFGTSMVDEYEEMETLGTITHHSLDHDEEKMDSGEHVSSQNLFGSARDVVLNIVRKAAKALGGDDHTAGSGQNLTFNEYLVNQTNASLPLLPQVKDQPLQIKSETFTLGRILDQCGFCVSSDNFCVLTSCKCRFFKYILNVTTVARLCQTAACSQAELRANMTEIGTSELPALSTKILATPSMPNMENALSHLNSDEEHSSPIALTETVALDSSFVPSKPLYPATESRHAKKTKDDMNYDSNLALNETDTNGVVDTKLILPGNSQVPELKSSLVEPILVLSISEVSKKEASNLTPTPSLISRAQVSVSIPPESPFILATEFEDQEVASAIDNLGIEDESSLPYHEASLNVKEPFVPPMEGTKPIPVHNVGVNIPTGQKESVFMRLSNRIKVLEMNMSLSSQYLQELSQRYRRQMEDMQRGFNRTVAALNNTAQQAAHRDWVQQEAIGLLQSKLANLNRTVNSLTNERESLYKQVVETHIFLLLVETIVVITILTLCLRRMRQLDPRKLNDERDRILEIESEAKFCLERSADVECHHFGSLKRHNSTNSITPLMSSPFKKLKSSKSESAKGMMVKPALPIHINPVSKARKKRKHKGTMGSLSRSVSNPDLNSQSDKCSESCSLNFSSTLSKNSQAGDLSSSIFTFSNEFPQNCENCCIYQPDLPSVISDNISHHSNKSSFQNSTFASPGLIDSKSKIGAQKSFISKESFNIRNLFKLQKKEYC